MRRSGSQRGMALVTVLWTIVLLSTAAMAASIMFRGYVGLMAVHKDRAQVDALLTAGLESAADVTLRLDGTPLNDIETTMSLSTGDVRIRLDDEGGLIDINKAPVALLAGLFRSIGVKGANVVAQAIVDARQSKPGDDDQPFTDVRELANIPGVRPDLIAALVPLTTVYGNETVNPMTAPPDVIAALPGMEEGRLRAFLDLRRRVPDDSTQLLAALGPEQKFAADKPSMVVGVRLDARVRDGYRTSAKAIVIAVDGDSQPYRVLAWNPIAAAAANGSSSVMAGQ